MKTSRNNCIPVIPFLVLFTGLLSASVQGQDLENKTFEISMHDVNMPDDAKTDVLTFKHGKLDSKECLPYGFSPSAYTSHKEKNGVVFKAACHSEKEGEMIWNGTVNGNSIQGNILWKKDGQKDITYEFKGGLKKKSST